jgi:hypothetical protein
MKKVCPMDSVGTKRTGSSLLRCLVIAAIATVMSSSRAAAAAVFYSSEFVSGVSMNGVASLNAHLHSTSSLTWTATFDYGLTSSYGSTVAGSTGANNVPPFYDGNVASASINGLVCGTTYHWAVVVAGAHDADQTFTTAACPAPAISVSPGLGGYGPVVVGSSLHQTFTISNTGTADLDVSNVSVLGSQQGEFAVSLGTCASVALTILPGSSCDVLVTFAPDALGRKSATLQFASNAGTVNVTLSGTGVGSGNVPTLSEWGTILLALAFATVLVLRAKSGVDAPV